MDHNRSKAIRRGPFPGSFVPLKLREIFYHVGLAPTSDNRVPWDLVPYALYDRGVYVTGLPTRLFFGGSERPTKEEMEARRDKYLKWPPPGVLNPLPLLEKACSEPDRLKSLPRPPGRDVVFELVSDDGTRLDLGQWRAPRPTKPAVPPPVAAPIATQSPIDPTMSPIGDRTLVTPVTPNFPPSSALSVSKPVVSNKLQTITNAANAGKVDSAREVPPKIPSSSKPPTASVSTVQAPPAAPTPDSGSEEEPFPKSDTIPLGLRKILRSAGLRESDRRRGRIPWKNLPEYLWDHELYISGLPPTFFLGRRDVDQELIDLKRQHPFAISVHKTAMKDVMKALERREIKVLKRPSGREVTFEVVTPNGKIDIGRWIAKEKEEGAGEMEEQSTSKAKTMARVKSPDYMDLDSDTSSEASSDHSKLPFLKRKASISGRKTYIASSDESDDEEEPLALNPATPKTPSSTVKLRSKTVEIKSTSKPSEVKKDEEKPASKGKSPETKKSEVKPSSKSSEAKPLSKSNEVKTLSKPAEVKVPNKLPEPKRTKSGEVQTTTKTPSKPTEVKTASKPSQSPAKAEPFPQDYNVPIEVRRLFYATGIREEPGKPGKIPWATIPDTLWRLGTYIDGLPREFVLGNQSQDQVIAQQWNPSSFFSKKPSSVIALVDDLREGGVIKFLRRPIGENVIFRVKNEDGTTTDIGKWLSPPSSDVEFFPDDEVVELSDSSSESEKESRGKPWQVEVNEVMDQLASILVEGGVQLPVHPTRKGAYKIVWHTLPKLLYEAKRTLIGVPLVLLPYNRQHGKLNGKWSIYWNRSSLDHMRDDLLDNDGIAVEKWNKGTQYVVTAFDGNKDRYDFTYGQFLDAEHDDPEFMAGTSNLRKQTLLDNTGTRKRKFSEEEYVDSPPPKRRRQTTPPSTEPSASGLKKSRTLSKDSDEEVIDLVTPSPRLARSLLPGATTTSLPPRPLSREIGPDWKVTHDPNLTVAQLNARYRRRKESLKGLIAILMDNDIPCIAPEDDDCAFFLPWTNLPKYLAARGHCFYRFPAACAPVIMENEVNMATGPAQWNDTQWDALERAVMLGDMDIQKAPKKHAIFELVENDGSRHFSDLGYTRAWIAANYGVQMGQPTRIFADSVSIMDPILEETDVEDVNVMDIDSETED
ncbi:hypothetical protein CPB86DRAFT_550261 [Serendipita vermifera]|nr:hypothetical protein CPB86DRAFT_550261 [Serendipita vermifera]